MTELNSLEGLWAAQGELNKKAGKDTMELGRLVLQHEKANAGGYAVPNGYLPAGMALNEYINAMQSETQELRDCTAWKHWYKEAKEGRQFELKDPQNARVEVIDMLFFWMSLAQILGLTPADVYRLYEAKLGINHKRQDENRSQAEHATHEDENRSVV